LRAKRVRRCSSFQNPTGGERKELVELKSGEEKRGIGSFTLEEGCDLFPKKKTTESVFWKKGIVDLEGGNAASK